MAIDHQEMSVMRWADRKTSCPEPKEGRSTESLTRLCSSTRRRVQVRSFDMNKIPPARLGAPRRADRPIDDHSSVSVHLSLPGWLVRELYGVAHSEHRSVSSVAALALTDFLDVAEPPEASEA